MLFIHILKYNGNIILGYRIFDSDITETLTVFF